jgi:hypothetical protein
MARLPVPGSDGGTWGTILNDFLSQAHDTSGALKSNAVAGGAIQDGAVSEQKLDAATQTKLNNPVAHTHADYVAKAGANIATLPDSATQFVRVNIPDDGSPTGGWPDRYANYFNGTRTGYFNEYGEVRARPAKTNTVAMRAMGHGSGSSGDIFQVTNSGQSATYLGVSATEITTDIPITSASTISATNIGAMVLVLDAADPVPPGTPVGTVILRRP